MIKVYENFITDLFKKKKPVPAVDNRWINIIYPDILNKKYWVRKHFSARTNTYHFLVLKFVSQTYHRDGKRRLHFYGIFKDQETTKKIPVRIGENVWNYNQKNGNIREATQEEIDFYNFYEEANKYNL